MTCPCKSVDNLAAARARKLDKYADIKGKLKEGYKIILDAFVVGMVGTWDPKNDQLLSTL